MKLELEKLESRLKGRKQREKDTYRRMFNASPPTLASPDEKHGGKRSNAPRKPGLFSRV